MSEQLNRRLAQALLGFYLVWLLLLLGAKLLRMDAVLSYSDMAFSDMLINYQGGFVRRGLFGEVLFRLYQLVPYDLGHVVLVFILLSAVACLSFLYRTCLEMNYSPVLLLSGFTLQFMALAEVAGVRRDYLTLLMALFAFWSYRRWLAQKAHSLLWLILLQVSLLLAVLFHEGVAFYVVPIIGIHHLYWQHNHLQLYWGRSLVRTVTLLLPVGLLILFVFLHKGTMSIAESIWDSWRPLFEAYPRQGTDTPTLDGTSVKCLACTTMDFVTGCSHHNWAYVYWGWFPMFPFTFLLFPLILYLVSFANVSQVRLGCLLSTQHAPLLTSILLIQLFMMSPLFICLSCDYGRLFCYWIISSLFAWWIFQEDIDCFPFCVQRIALSFHGCIAKLPFLLTPLGYVSVLVLTSCNMVGGAALGAIPLYRMLHESPLLLSDLFLSIYRLI